MDVWIGRSEKGKNDWGNVKWGGNFLLFVERNNGSFHFNNKEKRKIRMKPKGKRNGKRKPGHIGRD